MPPELAAVWKFVHAHYPTMIILTGLLAQMLPAPDAHSSKAYGALFNTAHVAGAEAGRWLRLKFPGNQVIQRLFPDDAQVICNDPTHKKES